MAEAELRNFNINFGPQHPAAHGVLRMVLELDGAPSQADLDIIRQIPDIRSCTFLKRRDD